MVKSERTNNDVENTETEDGATRTPLGCRVHRVTLLTNPVLSQE